MTPAKKAARQRRIATKRPKNTTLAPWLMKQASPSLMRASVTPNYTVELRKQKAESKLASEHIANVVADDCACGGGRDHSGYVAVPISRMNRGNNEDGLARQRQPHALQPIKSASAQYPYSPRK